MILKKLLHVRLSHGIFFSDTQTRRLEQRTIVMMKINRISFILNILNINLV